MNETLVSKCTEMDELIISKLKECDLSTADLDGAMNAASDFVEHHINIKNESPSVFFVLMSVATYKAGRDSVAKE